MVDRRFNKFLTVIVIIIAIAALVIIGFLGYDMIKKYKINSTADHIIDEFNKQIDEVDVGPDEGGDVGEYEDEGAHSQNDGDDFSGGKSSRNGGSSGISYDGYNIVGKIKIPKTGIEYPVLEEATVSSMQLSVGIVYGPGLNRIGNTVLMGHNYKNGTFFSDNDKLSNGDIIYITSLTGSRRRYRVYNKYVTTPSDFDYAVRNTAGRREITLASCTDDSKNRIIVWARES